MNCNDFFCALVFSRLERYGARPSGQDHRIWQTVNCISESMYMFCDGIFNFRYFSSVNLQQNQDGKASNQI